MTLGRQGESEKSQKELINELLDALPNLDPQANHEVQSRFVLRNLLVVCLGVGERPMIKPNSIQCPNCDAPTFSTRTPYCSTQCREEAGFIRQFRQALAERTIFDPDRQVAFGQIFWHLLGGGRPLRRGLLTEKEIAKVIAKAEGKCAECGQTATTVHHIGTACNRPINLHAVCAECCRIHEFGDPMILEKNNEKIERNAVRIANPHPVRICDAAEWDWRAFLRLRKAQPQDA